MDCDPTFKARNNVRRGAIRKFIDEAKSLRIIFSICLQRQRTSIPGANDIRLPGAMIRKFFRNVTSNWLPERSAWRQSS